VNCFPPNFSGTKGDIMTDKVFDFKLSHGLFTSAFDVAAKRFVKIQAVQKKPNGKVLIVANRVAESTFNVYDLNELTQFS
jgi:hypothetical protein